MSIHRNTALVMNALTGALLLIAGCDGAGSAGRSGQGGGAGAFAGGGGTGAGAPGCDVYDTFAPGVVYPGAPHESFGNIKSATSLAAADMNGDGKEDLVVVGSVFLIPYGSMVSVLLNHGDGTFGEPLDALDDYNPYAVAAADLDGDGLPDLVMTNVPYGDGYLTVVLNQGDGTFGAAALYPAGQNPYSLVAADLNGDGKPDLAVANQGLFGQETSTVSVLLNQGDGTFFEPIDYDAGPYSASIVAADFDGDGKLDLAIANQTTERSLSVLLNQGNGVFSTPVAYGTDGSVSIATADLNGDGKPDLVVDAGEGVSVWMNQGDGTFLDGIDYAAGGVVDSITAADVNGDGAPDVVTAAEDLRVLVNKGDGTFAEASAYASGKSFSNAVVAADLNGDGVSDLALGNNDDEATVFLATCSP